MSENTAPNNKPPSEETGIEQERFMDPLRDLFSVFSID